MSIAQLLAKLDEEEIVRLPIEALAGIVCKVKFIKHGNHFDIHTIHKYSEGDEAHDSIPEDFGCYDLSEAGLQEAIEDLNNVKFSKKENKFTIEEDITFEGLFTSNNYTPLYEDCPVCLEKTSRRTSCKHMLCFPCYLRIEKTCPICRKDIKNDKVGFK
jgi:hypothetical protein